MFKTEGILSSVFKRQMRLDYPALTALKHLIGGSLPFGPTKQLAGVACIIAVPLAGISTLSRNAFVSFLEATPALLDLFAPQCLTPSFIIALPANFGNRPLFETQPQAQLQRQPRLRLGHRTDSIRPTTDPVDTKLQDAQPLPRAGYGCLWGDGGGCKDEVG
jgi:hypothetical protein